MKSDELTPGTRLRHRPSGKVVTLDRRKREGEESANLPFHPGWWLPGDNGGLADFVIDAEDGDWEVVE